MNSLKVHIINDIACICVKCHIIIQRNWKFGNYFITSKYLPPHAVDVGAVDGGVEVGAIDAVTTTVVSPAIKIFVFILLDVILYKFLKFIYLSCICVYIKYLDMEYCYNMEYCYIVQSQ